MNRNAARLIDLAKDRSDLKSYFGFGDGISRFRRGEDFIPGATITLGEAAPAQLHDTETHPGGVLFVRTTNGGPDLRRSTIDMLDGVAYPHRLMRQAYEYLCQVDSRAYAAIEALATRPRWETVEYHADKLGITRQGAYERIDRAMEIIAYHINQQLGRIVGEETEGA